MPCLELGALFAGTWRDSVVPTVAVYSLLAAGLLYLVLIFAQHRMHRLVEAGDYDQGVAISRHVPVILPTRVVFLWAGFLLVALQLFSIVVSWTMCDSAFIDFDLDAVPGNQWNSLITFLYWYPFDLFNASFALIFSLEGGLVDDESAVKRRVLMAAAFSLLSTGTQLVGVNARAFPTAGENFAEFCDVIHDILPVLCIYFPCLLFPALRRPSLTLFLVLSVLWGATSLVHDAIKAFGDAESDFIQGDGLVMVHV